MEKRIVCLDVTKGIILVVVLFAHSCWFKFGEIMLTACFMCVFFVLSGYTHRSKGYKTYKELFKKRLSTILVPYVGWTIVVLAYEFIKAGYMGSLSMRYVIERFLGAVYSRACFYPLGSDPNYSFLVLNGAMWFLTALISAYAVFYVCLHIIAGGGVRKAEVSIALLAITAVCMKLPILLPWSIDNAFVGAFFMLMGHFARGMKVEELSRIDKMLIVIIAVVVYHETAHYNLAINMSVRMYGYHGALSAVLFAVIGVTGTIFYVTLGWLISKLSVLRRIFLRINKSAIVIIAMQFVYFDILNSIMPEILSENEWIIYGYGVLKVAINLMLCLLTDKFVRLIKKWGKRRSRLWSARKGGGAI